MEPNGNAEELQKPSLRNHYVSMFVSVPEEAKTLKLRRKSY
jgi:hypothetical protein